MLALSGKRTHGYVAKWLENNDVKVSDDPGKKNQKKNQAASAKPHVSNQNI